MLSATVICLIVFIIEFCSIFYFAKFKFYRFKKAIIGKSLIVDLSKRHIRFVRHATRNCKNADASGCLHHSDLVEFKLKDLKQPMLCIDVEEVCQTMCNATFITADQQIVSFVYFYKSSLTESVIC